MRLVCISDTHTQHDKIVMPEGDVLIHAGDYSYKGKPEERRSFCNWLKKQPYKYKLVGPGNHDFDAFRTPGLVKDEFKLVGAQLLIDEQIEIEGKVLYFSPWTPEFFNWAFMYPKNEGKRIWDKIPEDTDILITHGPAYGLLDTISDNSEHLGCKYLFQALDRIKPQLHISGHIHGGYGKLMGRVISVNAAICDEVYEPTNKPIVVEI